jgi:lipopolysaccharide transport system ATP-binding protein
MKELGPCLSLKGVSVEYQRTFATKSIFKPESWRADRGFLALKDINLYLKEGDRLGIVGPNGAGKTTLLRLLAGVYEPSSGSIERVGTIHHLLDSGFGLDSSLSGRENSITYAILHGVERGSRANFTDCVKDFSGIGDFFERPIREYSTGMLTKLVFSLATEFRPDILIMDEILGAGDAEFQDKASERLKEVVNQSSIVITATHSMQYVKDNCNRAILLENGRSVLDSTSEDVVHRYIGLSKP